jgi:hypothetical protein
MTVIIKFCFCHSCFSKIKGALCVTPQSIKTALIDIILTLKELSWFWR